MLNEVFGVPVTPLPMEDLVDRITGRDDDRPRLICTMNLDHVVQMRSNPRFRDAYASADVVTVDGAPVQAYAKAKGFKLQKIAGSDLFEKLMARLDPARHRVMFVLSSDRLCDLMRERLRSTEFDAHNLDFAVPPFGFEFDLSASRVLAQRIRAFAPTHVFFCLGAPKSEIWSLRHCDALGRATVLCVGASAEFHLGVKRRAPKWMQRAGLEWLWRWVQEPRRLFRRYFISSWAFLAAVRDDLTDSPRHRVIGLLPHCPRNVPLTEPHGAYQRVQTENG